MRQPHAPCSAFRSVALALALSSAACGGGGGGGGSAAPDDTGRSAPRGAKATSGASVPKPGGGAFFEDPHFGGAAQTLRLVDLAFGRLVDVHDVDDAGNASVEPLFRDLVIRPTITSDGSSYTLATAPVTQRTRLVVHAKRGSASFDALLGSAMQGLTPILPKGELAAPPFSQVPRNACLTARFDDLLDDDAAASAELLENVRVRVGLPPATPFGARVVFDPNHGGLAGGAFHSTRVLIDLTVSELEASALPAPLPVNPAGLPASAPAATAANVSVRVPTKLDPASGQLTLLRNLAGFAVDPSASAPFDPGVPTRDVVRAMRSGGPDDADNGFLLDLERPRVLGGMPLVVTRAERVRGSRLVVDLAFSSSCQVAPAPGDVLAAGGALLEVLAATPLGAGGAATKVPVRAATGVADPAALLGSGVLHAPFSPQRARRVADACWLAFAPAPASPPGAGVSTSAQVLVRFTEPVDSKAAKAFDAFLVVRGAAQAASTAGPSTIVTGDVLESAASDALAFAPALPLDHELGVADPYHVELGDVRDLAGNPLRDALPFVDFRIDPLEAAQSNGGLVLRFGSFDEVDPLGLADLRGQFFIDLDRGVLRPRPVAHASWPADRTNPVPSLMTPFALGVREPLNALGSKLQAVWRYCDFGWNVRDETKHNVDVLGLSWAPIGGAVISDFFPGFEIRLAHSLRQPDETVTSFLLPRYDNSGLPGRTHPFADNVLADPASPQAVVHPRALGYAVSASDLFVASSGRTMIPYPLNRGPGPDVTYTWRDTAVLAEGGPLSSGIPLDIEEGHPLFLEPAFGTIAGPGRVPSFGLPLLMEFRCFPSDRALGLNALDISLAVNSSPLPAFRAFSAGGFDSAGLPVTVDPDTAVSPNGGLNPLSTPPGRPTLAADNVFYIGQLDTVTRLSRLHTVWLDTLDASPDFVASLVSPAASEQPAGTAVQLAFRGATGFTPDALQAPFDATRLDPYGDFAVGAPLFLNGVSTWSSDLGALDGARFVQARVTFVGDLATGRTPELSALAMAYATN